MNDFIKESDEYLIPFYAKFPLCLEKGKKHWVWDHQGKKYLDFTSGIGVVNFGHSNPKVAAAVCYQMRKVVHVSNLYYNRLQSEFAKLICERAFSGKVFFCNSGAEANEAALKIARIVGNQKSPSKNRVLALKGSFHGRTIATISLTGQEKYKKGFEPLLQNIDFVEPNQIKDLKKKFNSKVCVIFLEAVQGEGGVIRLDDDFVAEAEKLARKNDALIVFDEIQAGMGRTGKYFGYQNFKVQPDMITMAKALGNGVPVGAVLVRNEISSKMKGGIHASTFGGNFAACAAGIASLNMLDGKLLSRIGELSGYFGKKLSDLKAIFPSMIKENRVYGLMIGIELNGTYPVKNVIDALIRKKVLALRAGENVLRLLPPYTVRKEDIDMFCRKLYEVFSEMTMK